MDIKPIETHYNGFRFRSRLEARWAVFFDALGIRYEYEMEGFEIQHEGKVKRYLPDFFLPDTGTWVEVKGEEHRLRHDLVLSMVEEAQLPGLIGSPELPWPGLLILGPIPAMPGPISTKLFGGASMDPTHYLLQCTTGGAMLVPCRFNYGGIESACALSVAHSPGHRGCAMREQSKPFRATVPLLQEVGLLNQAYCPVGPDTPFRVYPRIALAYKKARQARFEHGETP